MIFGFNTDIKVEDTVYHVQSEARTNEKLLQTQIFVKGHCIAKRAVSYAEQDATGNFSEESRHDLLREQHRFVVQAIRDGYIEDLVNSVHKDAAAASPASKVAEPTDSHPHLELKYVGSSKPSPDSIKFKFSVLIEAKPASGASVQARILPDTEATSTFSGGVATQAMTASDGSVEVTLPISGSVQGEANLVVHVIHEGLQLAKKFRVKTRS